MTIPTVVNKYKEDYDIYIGRGSYWGNPFPIDDNIGETREVVVDKYLGHLRTLYKDNKVRFMQELSELNGKRLGCFCKPKLCHGDRIVEVYIKLIGETQ